MNMDTCLKNLSFYDYAVIQFYLITQIINTFQTSHVML